MSKLQLKKICIKLHLSIPSIYDTLYLYEKFLKMKNYSYSNEVIQSTCIFISSKIHEEELIIRDIINVVLFEKNRNKILNEAKDFIKEKESFIKDLENENYSEKYTLISTMYKISIENYLIFKNDVIHAELSFLRDIKFNLNEGTYRSICHLIKRCEDYFSFNKFCKDLIDISLNVLFSLFEDDITEIEDIIKNEEYYINIIIEIGVSIIKEKIKREDPKELKYFERYDNKIKENNLKENKKYSECLGRVLKVLI